MYVAKCCAILVHPEKNYHLTIRVQCKASFDDYSRRSLHEFSKANAKFNSPTPCHPKSSWKDRGSLRGKVAVPSNEIKSKARMKPQYKIFTRVHVFAHTRYANRESLPESHPGRSYLRKNLVKEGPILFSVIRSCKTKITSEIFYVPYDPEHTPLYPVVNLTA